MKLRGWATCGLAMMSLAACGSSSSSSSSSTSSPKLTQTQWLAKANADCATLNAQTRALGPHPRKRPGESNVHTMQRGAAYLDRLVPLQVATVGQIRALGAPPQNAKLASQALAAADVLNADLKDAQAAGHAGNVKSYLAAIRGRVNGPDGDRATSSAQKAGLTACAG